VKVTLDTSAFVSQLNNMTQYSIGFLDGAKEAKPIFMQNFAETIVETLKNFIDSNARVNPQTLHHVYEWYETGSPSARLFDIEYSIKGEDSLSFSSTFSQSRSYAKNSTEPFYNKATIMENGTPVVIKPKFQGVLSFNADGQQVFTRKPIVVSNPGGSNVQGGFENIMKTFFDSYFTQSFLVSSGILEHFKDAKPYKQNFKSGLSHGKAVGFKVGYEWMAKGGRIE